MAFISHEHRLVFIHIPKTGGTSIAAMLTAMHGGELSRPADHYRRHGIGNDTPPEYRPNGIQTHDPWFEIVRKCPEARNYRVFCVVRNPWDRIYSFFRHKVRRRDRDLPLNARGKPHEFKTIFRISNVLLLQPQIWWTQFEADEAPHSLHAIRFEQFEEDLFDYFKTQGLSLPAIQPDRLNADPEPADYQDACDDYARRLIGSYYQKEIEQFGYEF